MTTTHSEARVCGGPADFMEVTKLTLRGTNRFIGRELAVIARDRLGVVKRPWTDPAATRAQREWLAANWPGHLDRMRGAAEPFDVDLDNDNIDMSFLFYYWGVPGCSNVYYPPSRTESGHAVLSRNYDFSTGTVFELMGQPEPPGTPKATSRPFIIEMVPDVGYGSLFTTSYELLGGCIDGMNEKGLGVALLATNEVMRGKDTYHPLGRNGVGLSEVQLPRYLLETCANAQEARLALGQAPQFYITVPCHYLVADRSGDAFIWSHASSPEAPARIDSTKDRPLLITNHLPGLTPIAECPARQESVQRLNRMSSAVRAGGDRLDRQAIRFAAESVAATLPPGAGQYQAVSPARTLWHAFYDLEELSVEIDFYLGEGKGRRIRRSPKIRCELPAPVPRDAERFPLRLPVG